MKYTRRRTRQTTTSNNILQDKVTPKKDSIHDEIYNGDLLIEKIFNSKKIKYQDLQILYKEKAPKGRQEAIIFIDVNNILNQLYNPATMENIAMLNNDEAIIISSQLINIAAHYRHYFADRKQMYTTFIYYYSNNVDKIMTSICPSYKSDYYNKRIFDIEGTYNKINRNVLINLKMAETIMKYLPNIYMINTGDIEPSLFPLIYTRYIAENTNDKFPIIYSNDAMAKLLPIYDDSFYVLTHDFKYTKLLNKMDILEEVIGELPKDNIILPEILPLLYSIAGYKKYNIEGIKGQGLKTAYKNINTAISKGELSNILYSDMDILSNDLENIPKYQNHVSTITANMEIFNPYIAVFPSITDDIILNFKHQFKDIMDAESLLQVNRTYYEKFPLQLEELIEGETYE